MNNKDKIDELIEPFYQFAEKLQYHGCIQRTSLEYLLGNIEYSQPEKQLLSVRRALILAQFIHTNLDEVTQFCDFREGYINLFGSPPETNVSYDNIVEETFAELDRMIDFDVIAPLSCIKEQLEIIISPEAIPKQEPESLMSLPAGFTPPRPTNSSPLSLTVEQTGLLFHYLTEHNVILRYDAKPLAECISALTGKSVQNLRTKAFGHIHDIKNQKNLPIIRKTLADIIAQIDIELENL